VFREKIESELSDVIELVAHEHEQALCTAQVLDEHFADEHVGVWTYMRCDRVRAMAYLNSFHTLAHMHVRILPSACLA
jgi:hypothetical protein